MKVNYGKTISNCYITFTTFKTLILTQNIKTIIKGNVLKSCKNIYVVVVKLDMFCVYKGVHKSVTFKSQLINCFTINHKNTK